MFDDASCLAVGFADDTSVAGGISDDAGEQRGGVAAFDMGVDEFAQGVRTQERRVARQHHDGRVVVVVVATEGGHADRSGVAGAVLLVLFDERDVGPLGRSQLHLLGDLFGAVPDDDGGAVGVEVLERMDDVQHHRSPADEVQRLGAAGTHAGALAGGKDDGGDAHGSGERIRTPTRGTKNRCPTIRRPRTDCDCRCGHRISQDRACPPGIAASASERSALVRRR